MHQLTLQQKVFLLLLAIVTIAFGWILLPYAGAIFWGVILAIVFAPVYRWVLLKTRGRATLSAMLVLLLILVIVILPLSLISGALVNQVASVVDMVRGGDITVAGFFGKVMDVLPAWAINLLDRFNLANLASLQDKLTAGASQVSQAVAVKAINIGLYTFDFLTSLGILMYLLFFLLRDGAALTARIRAAIPLSRKYKQRLFNNFTTVIRATVKGNILIAIAQGVLGGLIFWFLDVRAALLWGVLMAFLSLLPAIGAALVWAPVAIYFLATGSIWQGVTLIAFGILVIGLVDNLLRPVLVGKDTKMPDYVVLLSTVGGMALFGLHGFVIGPIVAAMFIAAWDLFATASEFHTE
ncbi:AI-2E family transporter [Janthinobacterium psychrotolerans]|uniref:Putative PurR-regulated permease PerM n=1 Tax=Janthinobacterium psychrotolerans TaxID=1747903 RepID=A0A1A7C306_9BURK|nr:AI-2E family transporter [Janthinobacterium psychrotolerans]OBV38698.1 putative PurR-regulated permease PerM [Janthinobacterium psychrotolerans]